jgi:hypothetical protein
MKIRKKSSLFFYVGGFVLMALYPFQLNAQEDNNTSKILKVVFFKGAKCKDIESYLKVTNKELKLTEFCADEDDLYEDKRIIDGKLEDVKIQRSTNMTIRNPMYIHRIEDDYGLVVGKTFFYDLNNDGTKEVFFQHYDPYVSAPFDILEKKGNTYKLLDKDGLIGNSDDGEILPDTAFDKGLPHTRSEIYILSNKTNGYHDIVVKSGYYWEKWLYQFRDGAYRFVEKLPFSN